MKIIRSFRKTISVKVEGGEVIVKAPYFVLKSQILKFVEKNSSWINKRLESNNLNKNLNIPDLKKKAKEYIIPRTFELAKKFNHEFNNIRITSAKTRWGSCSSKKNLSFTFRLILLPKEVVDYVIIHELTHLNHMNHSKRFWNEVKEKMPNYIESEKYLRENGYKYSF